MTVVGHAQLVATLATDFWLGCGGGGGRIPAVG
jgi:hypothetical protein